MIYCINEILSLIINTTIVIGILFLIWFYFELRQIDLEIEKLYKDFEEKKSSSHERNSVREFYENDINTYQKDLEILIAPLERKRQRILSKIPFIK